MKGWPAIDIHPSEMVCVDCGARWYSAAAKSMIERGATCDRCGGQLVLAKDQGDANNEDDANDEDEEDPRRWGAIPIHTA